MRQAKKMAEFMRERAVEAAAILTPNHFELDLICGLRTRQREEAHRALAALHARGPRVILVTSVELDETPRDCVEMLASESGALWRLRTPKAPIKVNGAGDVIAALFLAHWLASQDAADALARASASVYGLVKATAESGAAELALIAAQQELVAPSHHFAPERF